MKNKILITICFTVITSISFSQITKDSLVKMMAKDVCDELNKTTKDSKVDNLQEKLGMAMLPVFSKYLKEIKQVYNVTEINEASGEKIGEDIGEKLASDCPIFMKLILDNAEATKEIIGLNEKAKGIKLTGTLLRIVNGDITYFEVKTSSGKIEKIYWLEFFEGSEKLTNSSLSLLNKKITISYVEKEIYKSSLKDYSKIKVAASLTID